MKFPTKVFPIVVAGFEDRSRLKGPSGFRDRWAFELQSNGEDLRLCVWRKSFGRVRFIPIDPHGDVLAEVFRIITNEFGVIPTPAQRQRFETAMALRAGVVRRKAA